MSYTVLIPCSNDATGKVYKRGDVVTADDFPESVIAEWLKDDPPVLAAKDGG